MKINKKRILNNLLKSKNITHKELKEEIILMVCEDLLKSFIKNEISNLNVDIESNTMMINSKDDYQEINNIKLKDKLIILHKDIEDNILTLDKLEKILKYSGIKDIKDTLNPYVFYYNIFMTYMKNELENIQINKSKKLWLPDYLALNLIYFSKNEFNIIFEKFSILKKYDFELLINVYRKKSLEIKLNEINNSNKKIWTCSKTSLNDMEDVAENTLELFTKSNYY